MRGRAQHEIVGLLAGGRLALGPLRFSQIDLRFDRRDHAARYAVLQIKYIFQCSIEAIGPEMGARGGVDQLPGYTDPITCLPDAAFKDVAHAELAAYLRHAHRADTKGEARVTGDHEKRTNARETGDDLLDHSVSE